MSVRRLCGLKVESPLSNSIVENQNGHGEIKVVKISRPAPSNGMGHPIQ